ncbi:MAG TPA: glycosyltransferase [Solirubrobacterales bacterium]|nr:glycosyltransferase [Solirubrobacterales bacterium]
MRVLVVTNLVPDETTPQRGRWVRDQVAEVRARGVEVEEFGFPRGRSNYLPAVRRLRALLRRERFDLVHAHYGLAGWVARLAGARPLLVTFHGTDVRHPVVGPLSRRLAWRADLIAGVSRALFEEEDGRPGLPPVPGAAVLPCGPELARFAPAPRAAARAALGLDPEGRYLLFPADPARPEKRHDRAAALAAATGARLLTGGSIEPAAMATWMNAADAVLVTSDYEGFGMAAIEALACDVPVLSTAVGVAPYLLAGIRGCLCAPFDPEIWAAAARPHLDASDPRVAGAARAATLAAGPMADRVIEVYRHLTGRPV